MLVGIATEGFCTSFPAFSAHSQAVRQEISCSVQAYQSAVPRYVSCVRERPHGKSTAVQLSAAEKSAGIGTGRSRRFNCETLKSFPSPSPGQPDDPFQLASKELLSSI